MMTPFACRVALLLFSVVFSASAFAEIDGGRRCVKIKLDALEVPWFARQVQALREKPIVKKVIDRTQGLRQNPQAQAKRAFEKAKAKLAAFQARYPRTARLLSDIAPDRIQEPVIYLDRAIQILTEDSSFIEGGGAYDAGNMWHQNRGIDATNLSNLKNDPKFLKICQDLFDSTRSVDESFSAKIRARRSSLNIAYSHDHGLLVDDLPGIESFVSENKIDVRGMIYQKILANLSPEEARDSALVEDYFFKVSSLFHDESTASLLRKELGSIPGMQNFPDAYSIFYTNWLGVREPPEYVQAMQMLQGDIVSLHAESEDAFYGPGRFRLGYYHNNGALGVAGVASEGLFEAAGSERQLGMIQSRLALAYKTITLEHHRDTMQSGIFDYIRLHHPKLYAKYMTGTLAFKDIMGVQRGSRFEGGLFDQLLKDRRLTSPDFWQSTRHHTRGRVIDTEEAVDPASILAAIKNEQLLWLDLIRVSALHRASAEKIPELRRWIRSRSSGGRAS